MQPDVRNGSDVVRENVRDLIHVPPEVAAPLTEVIVTDDRSDVGLGEIGPLRGKAVATMVEGACAMATPCLIATEPILKLYREIDNDEDEAEDVSFIAAHGTSPHPVAKARVIGTHAISIDAAHDITPQSADGAICAYVHQTNPCRLAQEANSDCGNSGDAAQPELRRDHRDAEGCSSEHNSDDTVVEVSAIHNYSQFCSPRL